MSSNIVCRAYFSPHGSTLKIMNMLAKEFEGIRLICDLGKTTSNDMVQLTSSDIAIFGFPVFAGRIPPFAREQLKYFHGNRTPAIIYVTYGNRAYDDALLELKDILTNHGFHVISAAAFVCEHSIFTEVAKNHPNQEDMQKVEEFAHISRMIYEHLSDNYTTTLEVKGNQPYRKYHNLPIKPISDESCIKCGKCSEICPTKAISMKNPKKTNRWKCITCTSCIHICPVSARHFQGAIYEKTKEKFVKDNMDMKNPEIFM